MDLQRAHAHVDLVSDVVESERPVGACVGPVSRRAVLTAVGTADPHAVGDVVKAPSSLRGVVCADSARCAAFGAELEYRCLPVANVAPVTSPLDELPEEWVEPTLVTSSDKVMTADERRCVRVWRRQLRRCFHAARQGELHRARRLRPADLWLPRKLGSCPRRLRRGTGIFARSRVVCLR